MGNTNLLWWQYWSLVLIQRSPKVCYFYNVSRDGWNTSWDENSVLYRIVRKSYKTNTNCGRRKLDVDKFCFQSFSCIDIYYLYFNSIMSLCRFNYGFSIIIHFFICTCTCIIDAYTQSSELYKNEQFRLNYFLIFRFLFENWLIQDAFYPFVIITYTNFCWSNILLSDETTCCYYLL